MFKKSKKKHSPNGEGKHALRLIKILHKKPETHVYNNPPKKPFVKLQEKRKMGIQALSI